LLRKITKIIQDKNKHDNIVASHKSTSLARCNLKKIVRYILLIIWVISLTACGQTGGESEDTQSFVGQDSKNESGNALLYAGGDDLDSFLSEFDEKYYGFLKENITRIELVKKDSNYGLHIYASGISMEEAQAQMEAIFGIKFEENDGALLFNDEETATVYILDISEEGIYVRYDFFDNELNNELDGRGYFSIFESVMPEISANAVEVERAFYHDVNGVSEVYITYEYPEEMLSQIWDDYQEKLSKFDNYELVKEDGAKGVVYLDNGLIIETSVDTGWGRMFVTLRKAVEE
jgi:uncharacterized lipoprotein YehR (DUF1307 family)